VPKPSHPLPVVLALWALCMTLSVQAQSGQSEQTPLAVPGGIYVWPLPAGANNIHFNNRPVLVNQGRALIGIALSQPLGSAEIRYQLDGATRVHHFTVQDKAYTEQHITLKNREMVNPNPQQLARIREESRRQRQLYLRYSDYPTPQQGFVLPLEGRVSSLFGHRRFFNGEPRNPHSGLDIAAPTGTPVLAPASGQVVLVDNLYYNGKTVFLDHGQGLITMYCHLSEQAVAEGESVEQGQVIGLVGATGRVTGPHLHWSVSLNGYRVNPTTLMALLPPPGGS